jgi:hypothetical protein
VYRKTVTRFISIIAALALSACSSDAPTVEQQCARVRDRLIDLRLSDASGVDVKAHRAVMKRAMGENFIASCRTNMAPKQRDCVLGATDLVAATACTARTENLCCAPES